MARMKDICITATIVASILTTDKSEQIADEIYLSIYRVIKEKKPGDAVFILHSVNTEVTEVSDDGITS